MAVLKATQTTPQSIESMCHAVSGNMETLTKALNPLISRIGRTNLEYGALVSRRARAYLEIPGRAAACRTPQDLVNAQLAFWQQSARDYGEASERTMAALLGTDAPQLGAPHDRPIQASQAGAWPALTNPWAAWMQHWSQAFADRAQPRDYMTLPEQAASRDGNRSNAGGSRKAA